MRSWLFMAVWLLSVTSSVVVHASGPVERLVQVLLHPNDSNIVVVRWGVASEGYLYSRDGGRTFAALCSAAITPLAGLGGDAGIAAVARISSQVVNSNAATLLDGEGRLQLTQLSGLWSDDGTGCSWSRGLVGGWPTALQLEPDTGELLAVVNVTSDAGDVRALLLRRDARGAWSSFAEGGELIAHVPGQQAYGGELQVAGSRLYATVRVSQGSSPVQSLYVVRSDDGGKSWSRGPLPVESSETFSLVASDATHLLGARSDDLAADSLLLSQDEGASFQPYGQLRALTGVAIAPDGTLYVSDRGDTIDAGGLWTATRLGAPLRKVEGTAGLDCVTWSEAERALYLCQGDRVRRFDPVTERFVGEDVVRISHVSSLLSCPGADIGGLCQDQLNQGASWCCTGHYPCSPFCATYDITMRGNERVFCGKAGLAYDVMSGRSCDLPSSPDAGRPDAGNVTAPRKRADGCALAEHDDVGVLSCLGLLLWGCSRRRARSRS